MSDVIDVSRTIRSGAVALQGYSELVWVTGPDAVSFLDGLLSQNIAVIEMGTSAPSLLLAPNGKLRATLHVFRAEDRVGLVCDIGYAEVVASDLLRFKIRVDVAIQVESRPVFDVWGSGHAATDVAVEDEGVQFAVSFRNSPIDRTIVVGGAPAGIEVVARDAVEAFRIEIGEPVMGVDLDEGTIPQEGADVAGSVDFAKGCYLGQELVARIDSRGHVNRRLCGLVVAGSSIPAVGSEVVAGDKVVGSVTSVAWSNDRQTAIALAMLRIEAESGAVVAVGPTTAQVADLPLSR